MILTRLDRLYVDVDVTAADPTGAPATLAGADMALLPPRATPTTATVWTAADYTSGVATVLLAGPDADPTGALPVPDSGADLWLRVVDDPEVLAVYVDRITIR